MRIDLVTIFPEYFDVLDVSLLGKAREAAIVETRVHNLRDWTTDVHHTVDDAPFGGGAGMVMKANVWGRALDDVLAEGGRLVIPTPAGVPFTQAMAEEMAREEQLVFACGRYEGIDARVAEHYAATHRVSEVSLGDYVLNGGEVAALAMMEAVVRLLPGFVGNAESLVEESHADGLLEYPSYTRPASWRGLGRARGPAGREPRRDRGLAPRGGGAADAAASARSARRVAGGFAPPRRPAGRVARRRCPLGVHARSRWICADTGVESAMIDRREVSRLRRRRIAPSRDRAGRVAEWCVGVRAARLCHRGGRTTRGTHPRNVAARQIPRATCGGREE